ncbi:hypothetical protein M0R45_035916 [Rubus argutus]|uniref:Uncharacterized protein n=1 Tax=Rubus argutus TaxID=59490 RepID=A0AAW1VY78_RUBAR
MQQLDYKKKNQYSILTIPVCDVTTADNIDAAAVRSSVDWAHGKARQRLGSAEERGDGDACEWSWRELVRPVQLEWTHGGSEMMVQGRRGLGRQLLRSEDGVHWKRARARGSKLKHRQRDMVEERGLLDFLVGVPCDGCNGDLQWVIEIDVDWGRGAAMGLIGEVIVMIDWFA